MTGQPIDVANGNFQAYCDLTAKLESMADMARAIGQTIFKCRMEKSYDIEDMTYESTMDFYIEVSQESMTLRSSWFEHSAFHNRTRDVQFYTFLWRGDENEWDEVYSDYLELGAVDPRPSPIRANDDAEAREAQDAARFAAVDADLGAFICSWHTAFTRMAERMTNQQPGWRYNFAPRLSWSIVC